MIEEILPRLAEAGVLQGLVTGNIEAAAQIKLARANLNRYFQFGGYGSDASDRTEVTEKALARADAVAGAPIDRATAISVGDTPRDISAGHGAGIRVVGVATGSYTVDQQREAGADWPIADVPSASRFEGRADLLSDSERNSAHPHPQGVAGHSYQSIQLPQASESGTILWGSAGTATSSPR